MGFVRSKNAQTARLSAAVAFVFVAVLLSACTPRVAVVEEEVVAPPVAQEDVFLAAPLGLDPAVRSGVLENGLTYYVLHNTEPRQRAELRLVVDAGSILEEEDQRGLAHLLEHMAFNGTERFPGIELQRYLERIGMRFGPDINAYINFDETVYMLQVPTDDPELLDTGLTVLREWAANITLLDEDIDAERGVVLEEWRGGRGAWARIADEQFPVVFAGSRYAERLPIGLPEVIQHAPADRLRDFYRDWYRPELMAVIAVGDFDPDEIAATIRERFADLENRPDAPERGDFDVPPHQETHIVVSTDPEQMMTTVQLSRKLPAAPRQTVADFREQLIDRLYSDMMNARLREISRRPDAPFLGANALRGGFVRPLSPFNLNAFTTEDGVAPALAALLEEAARVREHGFTETELSRARANVLRSYERAYEEREQRPSRVFAQAFIGLYLQGHALPGIEREYVLAQELLPTIALDEIDRRAELVGAEENRVVLVAMPEKEGLIPPPEDELRTVLGAVDAAELEPYVDTAVEETLITELPPRVPIVSESRYEDEDIVEWQLANGVTVVLKQTDFRNDEVLLTGFRPGGTSLVSDDLYAAASQAGAAIATGGVGDFSASELERFMAGKTIRITPAIGQLRETVTGSFSPADAETALQLLHLYFTVPRRDEEAFEAHKRRTATFLQNRGANPMMVFIDTLAAVMTQHHPRGRPLSEEEFTAIELDDVLYTYRERFGDAHGFTFIFVGAIDPETLAPLAERYLATLPADPSSAHEPRDLGIRSPPGVVERTVYKGIEPQAFVALSFSGTLRHDPRRFDPLEQSSEFVAERQASLWERFRMGRLAEALQIRLREELREDRGAVYGVMVNASPDRFTGSYTFAIHFGTDPERVDELVEAVFDEIELFQTSGPDRDVLDRVIERHRRAEETELRTNRRWNSALFTAYLYGDPPQDYLYGEERRQRISVEDLRRTATDYLDRERYVRVVLLPEETR